MSEKPPSSSFGLAESGYKQALKRGTLHKFAMFALSFTIMSILVGTTALTGFGFGAAGPAFWWTWVGVSLGQLAVAFVLAEVSAEFPLAGSVYNWAGKVASPFVGWMAGYLMLWTYIIGLAGVGLTFAIVLPQISDVFLIVPEPGPNGFIIGTVALALATVINLMRVKVAGWVNAAGVVLEFVVLIAIIIAFLFHAQRGPEVVIQTAGIEGPDGLFILALLVAAAAPSWVLYGFEVAGTLAEESANPRREGPRAIIQASVASGVAGILLILTMLMALPDADIESPANVAEGSIPYALKAVLGGQTGDFLLYCLVAAIFAALVAVQHGTARMMFAMGRDNNLPFGAFLSRINKRQSPSEAAVVIALVAVALMSISMVNSAILSGLAAASVVIAYGGYLCLTIPLLRRRFKGTWPTKGSVGQTYFSLGKWGKPLNIFAVVWGSAFAIVLAWPWPELYNPNPPYDWFLLNFGWVFTGAVIAVGAIWYLAFQRHRTGVVAAHRYEDSKTPPEADEANNSELLRSKQD